MADIKSETRPASNRNRWPTSSRNHWPASSEYAFIASVAKERKESSLAKRLHFERLYSEWLRLRSVDADPDQDDSDALRSAGADRVERAARLLLSTPAELLWMVHWKVEVMEVWLDREDTKWTDNRVTFALGCIKADLARFIGPGDGIGVEEPEERPQTGERMTHG